MLPNASRSSSVFAIQILATSLALVGCGGTDDARDPVNVAGGGLGVAGVSLQAVLGGQFLTALNNGGGAVNATAAVVQDWERFSLVDINGGSLESGDRVFIQAGNGQFFQALNGGGSTLNVGSNNQLEWETFTVVRQVGPGTVNNGDVIGLQTVSGSWVSAQNGGGGPVFAYGGALGLWEQLRISGLGGPNTPPAPPPPPAPSGSALAPAGWRLVWSDEFNGNGLDGSKWSIEQHAPGWVNDEWQSYTARPENVRVENGHLVIEGRHDFAGGGEYSSGRINTAGHASWTYGRMEARIQVPGGWGTWPGFWMMPNDFSRGWPACGEIDIMEEVGYDQDTIHGTTHTARYNWVAGTQRTAAIGAGGVTTGYHLYAVEWSPSGIDFFVDDRKYFTSPNDNTGDDAWPFHKDFYFILNLAIGGDWGGAQGVDPNIWPRQMLVDYVRVYER